MASDPETAKVEARLREIKDRLEGRQQKSAASARCDPGVLPLYGCLTGITLPSDRVDLAPGISMHQCYVDLFGAPMMAFSPPPHPNAPHPAPWAAVEGGFAFEARTEVAITNSIESEFKPSLVAWLVGAIMRLQLSVPIRMALLSNAPFAGMREQPNNFSTVAFEDAPHQFGAFDGRTAQLTEADISWVRDMLPGVLDLYREERFNRAFAVFEQAQWCSHLEIATVLLWTAIEALLDLGPERNKTRALSKALSEYITESRSDRDHAYQVIREQYEKRGRVVHVGRSLESKDFLQSYRFARVAFRRTLIDRSLPPAHAAV